MSNPAAEVTVTGPEAGETLDILGAPIVVKADPATGPLFAGEQHAPPGYGVPLHVHAEDHEMFWILEGELTLLGPDGARTAGPGSFVDLPAGVAHGFRNDGAVPARFLAIATPGVQLAAMFRHFDRANRAPGGLSPADVPAICAQYGVGFVG
jgi:mannose-6-phosphate isomerase-like protein (cupin superfamily)